MFRERAEQEDNGKPRQDDRKLSALDRAILTAIGDGRVVGRSDDPAKDSYPTVWEWLTKTEGGKDYVMQPAVLTIQLGPEGVLASLTHRDLRVTCSIACPTVADVLPTLERELSGPNPPLKSWGKDLPNLKRRRQK